MRMRCIYLLVLITGLGLWTPSEVEAERTHRVRSGQTLAQIARRYRVRVSNLAGANSMALNSTLRSGQVLRIPDRGVIYVARGQTLARIARSNDVSIRDLRRVNRLRPGRALSIGQRLVLPGHETSQTPEAAQEWGEPRSPGVIEVVRTDVRERMRLRLFDRRGRVRQNAANRLRRLLRHRRSGESLPVPRRLMRLLVRVSDHFGGRTMYIVSGHRPAGGHTRTSSRHVTGEALDFRIEGVPNTTLRDFCRTFDRVGVGFYPNSTFVHLDVRDRSAYWVDRSGPGEAPRYDRRSPGATE